MTGLKNRKNQQPTRIALVLFMAGLLMTACGNDASDLPKTPASSPEGFTFQGLHANSILSNEIKDNLSDKLGSAAIETRTVLDLEMHYNGFLKTYLPDLHELNRRLNFEKGLRIRIEHHTIKLIYRYASSFNYVELFFSNFTKKPLLFRIKAKKDGTDNVETFRKKYGTPREIIWENKEGRSFVWKQNKDELIISLFSDRYGNPRFEIMICHVKNIEALLAEEESRKNQMEKNRAPTGESAF
jgi:hypothetical protein